VTSDLASREVQNFMLLMPLVQYGPDGMAHPWLAESWDTVRVAPDSLDITFHLRRDILWHDGTPTTAEDVLFTFDRAVNPSTGSTSGSLFGQWSPAGEVLDSFTVRFRFRPHEEFLSIWNSLAILPEHILGDVPPAELARHEFGHATPMGNGPFRFVRRDQGQQWVFEANEEFPEALGGRPFLDRIVLRVIPDATSRMTELLTGRLDLMGVSPNQIAEVENAPEVEFRVAPSRSYVYVGWNTQRPLFEDPRVRRALSLGLDRQAIVDALLYGQGEIGVSTTAPLHWVYDDEYKSLAPRYDPDGARRLLEQAGWTPGPDGVLVDDSGQRFEFPLIAPVSSELYRDIAPIVEAQLRQLGIAVQPRTLEWNTFVAMLDGTVGSDGRRQRDFDAVISGWTLDLRQDDTPYFHTRAANDPYAETGFTHPRVDVLIDTLNVLLDRSVARPLWQEYHELLLENAPYATLMYPNQLLAHSQRLRGVEFDVRGAYAAAHRWWIHPALRDD
jgi:peptide/nickel transport system substrate-binding protein